MAAECSRLEQICNENFSGLEVQSMWNLLKNGIEPWSPGPLVNTLTIMPIPGWAIPKAQKMYLMPPRLMLGIIRYASKAKWSNPEKGVALSSTLWCSRYQKGCLQVTLRLQSPTYIYIYIYICVCINIKWKFQIKIQLSLGLSKVFLFYSTDFYSKICFV